MDKLRAELTRLMGMPVHVNVEEIRKPEVDALLVAQNVAQQLERRVRHQRGHASRDAERHAAGGAEGIKVRVAGRLNGAEIARAEVYAKGAYRYTPCGQTSTTPRRSPRPPTAFLA